MRSASFTNVCQCGSTDGGASNNFATGNRRPSRLITWPPCSAHVGDGNTTSAAAVHDDSQDACTTVNSLCGNG